MKTKPTSLPWHITKTQIGPAILADNHERVIYADGFQNQADAEFICRACNAHDDLVAALQKILDGDTMRGRPDFTHADVLQEHYKIAREALKKTKGEI